MRPHGIRQYQQTRAYTADSRFAVLYLYDVAIRAGRQAAEALEQGNIRNKCVHLEKALSAVTELAGALDVRTGGALAGNLNRLYAYVQLSLIRANAGNDREAILGAMSALRILREGWETICEGPLRRNANACDATGEGVSV